MKISFFKNFKTKKIFFYQFLSKNFFREVKNFEIQNIKYFIDIWVIGVSKKDMNH